MWEGKRLEREQRAFHERLHVPAVPPFSNADVIERARAQIAGAPRPGASPA